MIDVFFPFLGSCTLTPATGKPKSPSVTLTPSISLQKISSNNSKLIAPSVTLTPSDPGSKIKKLKLSIHPTATITPVVKKEPVTSGPSLNLKPLFPSKPLEKAELNSVSFTKLGKPLIAAASIEERIVNPEQLIITPEIPQDDEDFEQLEENNMVLEPQIILDDNDDIFEEKENINENDVDMEEEETGKIFLFCQKRKFKDILVYFQSVIFQ